MRILAVIPARGGSKGLPGKNIRPLAGLPLLGHSLACAALCPQLARTIVSTDDAAIADVARGLGGDLPFSRPAELARDDTPMMPVLRHALVETELLSSSHFDAVLLLDPTSPGRLPADVEQACALLEADAGADGVVACSRPTFNPFWVGVTEDAGYMKPLPGPSVAYTRRQDVPPFFRINGALYLWRRDYILTGSWPAGKNLLLEIPEQRAFSIDDESEFRAADALIRAGVIELPWLLCTGSGGLP